MEIEPWIETQSGRQIFFDDPDKSDFCIEDIARALSRIPRFAGHTNVPYSVAQHSVLVSSYCRDRLWGLMHDAAEAFISDIPGPAKQLIPEIHTLEHTLRRAIGRKFNLPCDVPEDPTEEYRDVWGRVDCLYNGWYTLLTGLRDRKAVYPLDVQAIDRVMLLTEHQWLFDKPLEWLWALGLPCIDKVTRWDEADVWIAEDAEKEFLLEFRKLTADQDTITCSLSGCVESVTEIVLDILADAGGDMSEISRKHLEQIMKEALQKNAKES